MDLREEKLSGERKEETQPSKVAKQRKNEEKSSNQEKVSNKPNTSNQNSKELATATQVGKKKNDDIGAKKSIPQNKSWFWGGKNLTWLNEEKTFFRNLELVQWNDNENGLH